MVNRNALYSALLTIPLALNGCEEKQNTVDISYKTPTPDEAIEKVKRGNFGEWPVLRNYHVKGKIDDGQIINAINQGERNLERRINEQSLCNNKSISDEIEKHNINAHCNYDNRQRKKVKEARKYIENESDFFELGDQTLY